MALVEVAVEVEELLVEEGEDVETAIDELELGEEPVESVEEDPSGIAVAVVDVALLLITPE